MIFCLTPKLTPGMYRVRYRFALRPRKLTLWQKPNERKYAWLQGVYIVHQRKEGGETRDYWSKVGTADTKPTFTEGVPVLW